ncbi:MAG TPA: dienelactone hydrolase family protein [Chitinophagaceae bacterium]|nr:dienelactone hydrolase family protein [Chitinophagaceae bacterium]
MSKYLPAALAGFILLAGCTPKPAEPVFAGLAVYKTYDSSRTFDTTKQSKNIYRPVKIDVFYPSAQKPATPGLTFGDIMDMYEQRFNFNTPVDSCHKTTVELARLFCNYFHINSVDKYLNTRLTIYKGLAMPRHRLPLIIYAAGMNGSAWDNPVLFDSLANNGYVVACVSSVGKYPGYMSDPVDMDEQVQDILFTIKQMKAVPWVDSTKIGIVSWSMGGTAAVKAALQSKDIKAIASYDGTDIHAYGPDKGWDSEYNAIRAIPPANMQDIKVPYMYLRSEHPNKIDSMYSCLSLASSQQKFFVKFTDAIHEDFSSLPVIAALAEPFAKNTHSNYHAVINRLTCLFFDEYVKKDKASNTAAYIDGLVKSDSSSYSKKWPEY